MSVESADTTIYAASLSASTYSTSLGANVTLTVDTGVSNECVHIMQSVNGGAYEALNPGAACPYTTDNGGKVDVSVGMSVKGTYKYYAVSKGATSPKISISVNAPTISLTVANTHVKTGGIFYFYATVKDQSGNGISGIAVSFEDLTTAKEPTGSGNPVVTDKNGDAQFNILFNCNSCFIGVDCKTTWNAYIIVGANNVSITSNSIDIVSTC